jgi:hypothetical protein
VLVTPLNPPQTCSGAATRESRRGAGYENARGTSLGCSAPEALFTKSNVQASVQTNVQTNVQGMFRQQSPWVGLYSRCACRFVEAVAGQMMSLYVAQTVRAGDFGLRGSGTNPGGVFLGPLKGGTCG